MTSLISTKAIKSKRKWLRKKTIFHFIISRPSSSSSSLVLFIHISSVGKQGSWKNIHYLLSHTHKKTKALRDIKIYREKDIKWKNNSASFSYQLPIYHENSPFLREHKWRWWCDVFCIVVGQTIVAHYYFHPSCFLHNGMNKSPFLLRSQGVPFTASDDFCSSLCWFSFLCI